MSAARKAKDDKGRRTADAAAQESEARQGTATTQQHDADAETAPLDEAEQLRSELGELKEQNLRIMAELRNVQQRLQREKQQSVRFAVADFAKELLLILDDLERTEQAVGEDAAQTENVAKVLEGVRIVKDHFMQILRKHGVEPIAAEGEEFDPDRHEAMMQQPSDEVEKGIVLQELSRGYRMHDRVLRSAKVIVSSGKP